MPRFDCTPPHRNIITHRQDSTSYNVFHISIDINVSCHSFIQPTNQGSRAKNARTHHTHSLDSTEQTSVRNVIKYLNKLGHHTEKWTSVFHHHRSIRSTNRHRTNDQADFAGSKQLCTQHGLIGEHTSNPSIRESKSSANKIFIGLPIFSTRSR